MKKFFFLLLISINCFSQESEIEKSLSSKTNVQQNPVDVVENQLKAYNERNLEAFLESYADNIEIYDFPDKLIAKGKDEMRKMYSFFGTLKSLHCEILTRIIEGNTVIDKEKVTVNKGKSSQGTAIYKIENYKISKVYFVH